MMRQELQSLQNKSSEEIQTYCEHTHGAVRRHENKESRVGNMAVRDEIIKTLEENRGTYLSGEQLAKKLSVSRAAVWKAIRKLQEDGFAIEA